MLCGGMGAFVYDIYLFLIDTVALTNGELWYRKLVDVINNAQLQHVWMSENKVSQLLMS